MKHLWEIDHPYYCSESNYYAAGCNTQHKTWADFFSGMGDADMDMNLLFRFDWQEDEVVGDDFYRNGSLQLFFMGQRKGLFYTHEIEVCRADETAVLDYLRPRFMKIIELWEPFGPPSRRSALSKEPGE